MSSCRAAVMTGTSASVPLGPDNDAGCGDDCAQAAGATSTNPSQPPNAAC